MHRFRWGLAPLMVLTSGILSCYGSEADALAISANIQASHLPFGTVLDPIYASPASDQVIGYTRCGDSALWTGAYLAAEAFRYKVTQSADALNNVQQALAGLKGLADVTGNNLLARCMFLSDSPYAAGIQSEESHNGVYKNPPWIWIGNTSRDQFVGVIFGLGAAYDLIDDATIKRSISDLVTRLLGFLTGHNWSIIMPDGSSSATFLIRPDEILALLQVGRHVNGSRFSTYYDEQRILLLPTVAVPASVDIATDDAYFKFNLDYMSFYNLVRLESSSFKSFYQTAYRVVRSHTASHQNAFFDIIDRALEGVNATRDAETRTLLEQWLQRPKRDLFVDLTRSVQVCGDQACQPVPVALRPPTDFLWQRNPFQLMGGGSGIIENPGIDYILLYWMSRYYGVLSSIRVQSSAASSSAVAPNSLASLYGSGLASGNAQANLQPLATLGGVTLTVTDITGTQRIAPLLYVSPGQVNFVVPDGTAPGAASFTVNNGSVAQTAMALIEQVEPTLFSMNGAGTGVAAATAIQVRAVNPQEQYSVAVFQCGAPGCVSVPINLGVDTPTYLTLYATGIRYRSALSNVHVAINGISVPVLYAGPQPNYAGLDQVNVGLSLSLRGAGESNVVLTVDGKSSNTVTINIK